MLGSTADLLRLCAIPVFGWAAYRDIKTRRVPNRVWLPLAVLALAVLVWDGYHAYVGNDRLFFLQVALSVGFIVPLATAFWYMGSFGGADAKAFYVVALLFPAAPIYYLPTVALPLRPDTVTVLSLTILSNTVVVGVIYPLGVTVSNLLRGRFGLPMLIGRPIGWQSIEEEYGMLLETPDGFTRRGVDLDALRMYLRWRGCTLAELRDDPDWFRNPESLPGDPGEVGDGNVVVDGGDEGRAERGPRNGERGAERPVSNEGEHSEPSDRANGEERPVSNESPTEGRGLENASGETASKEGGQRDPPADVGETDDPWGTAAFLDDIEGGAYGTTPEGLREGLDILVVEDEVWISPGIPFIVPMFVGLVISLAYGDVLVALLSLFGIGG